MVDDNSTTNLRRKPFQLSRILAKVLTITTDAGVVSGFVKSTDIDKMRGTSGYVKGTVLEVTSDKVKVRIPGSFFTSASGVTSVSSGWARENLQAA